MNLKRWLWITAILCVSWPAAAMAVPDLVVDTVTGAPATVGLNQAYSIKVCVSNKGATVAKAPFKVALYVSGNTTYTSSDRKVGESSITTDLAATKQTCLTITGKFPGTYDSFNFRPGNTNLFAWVDSGGTVAETNNNNNIKASSGRIAILGPDLVVTKITGFPKALPAGGSTVKVTVCVKNNGNGAAGAFKTAVIYSTNSSISLTLDTKIGEFSLPSLAKGIEHCEQNVSLKLPATVSGSHYIAGYVDSEKKVGESDEFNNDDFKFKLLPEPDLIVEKLDKVPATAKIGDSVTMDVCVKNTGKGDAKTFNVGLYYSSNRFLSTFSDTRLASKPVTGLKAGASICVTLTGKIPANATLGTRYFGGWADYDDKVTETSNSNNNKTASFSVVSARLLPDLVVDSLKVTTPAPITPTPAAGKPLFNALAGGVLVAEVCVKNQGRAEAKSPIAVEMRISGNTIYTSGDLLVIKGSITKNIAVGKTECTIFTTRFPATISSSSFGNFKVGTNNLFAQVDAGNAISENVESNNIKAVPFTVVVPDLVIDSIAAVTGTPKPGDPLTSKVCVKNIGGVDVKGFRLGLYFSENASLSTFSDILLASHSFTGVAKGKTVCHEFKVTFPSSFAPGKDAYIGAWADDTKKVGEKSESNNTKLVKFTAGTYDPADLVIDELSGVPTTPVKPGDTINVKVCTKNTGKGDATAFSVGVYHSTNTTITATDTLLATIDYPQGLKAAAKDCKTLAIVLSGSFAPKSKGFIGAFADHKTILFETSESNNTKSASIEFADYPLPDLIVSSLAGFPKKTKEGDVYNVGVCVDNVGKGDHFGPFKLSLFHSTNSFISSSDTKLGEAVISTNIKKGGSTCHLFVVTWPKGLSGGFAGAIVDSGSVIRESNENNNTKSFQFDSGTGTPQPDLTVTKVTVSPKFGTKTETLTIEICTKNIGTADVTKVFTLFYAYSTNTFISTSDKKLKEFAYSTPTDLAKFKVGAAGDCRKETITLTSSGILTGTGYIGGFVDSKTVISESNEGNNTAHTTYTVSSATKPNLVLTELTVTPDKQDAGKGVDIKVCVLNAGKAIPAATSFKLAVYALSSNTTSTFSYKNKFKEFPVTAGLAANTTKCYTEKAVIIPLATPAGDFWLGAWVDYDNKVSEYSTSDNRKTAKVTVYADVDKDGVPSHLDCDDNDKTSFPAYKGKPAGKEVCDLRDNNCDGQIDETFKDLGKACTAGQGPCKANGVNACKADGTAILCNAVPSKPGAEKCNGKDDDCDGMVDNGANADCATGEACIAGACKLARCTKNGDCPTGLVCQSNVCAMPAACTKDTDCTKNAGETCINKVCTRKTCAKHSECAKDQLCIDGGCVNACKADADCGKNHVCQEGWCWQKCAKDDECHSSQACVEGSCQETCTTPCKKGERCKAGKCVEDTCYSYACANSTVCLKTKCEADKCYDKKCGADEFCYDGNCVKTCGGVRCKADESCTAGACKKDDCAGIKCAADKVCVAGKCEDDKCKGKTCGNARYCDATGTCGDDPCAYVTCPKATDEVCRVNQAGEPQCTPKKPLPPLPEEKPVTEPAAEPVTEPVTDAGNADTGAPDTGTVDTGTVDTGTVDTGTVDTGAVDTGAADEGTTDTGAADEGTTDIGSSTDTVITTDQGGTTDGTDPTPGGGCCSTMPASSSNGPFYLFAFLFLIGFVTRRRKK